MKRSTGLRVIAVLALAGAMGGCLLPAGGGRGGLLTVTFITREPPADRVEVMSRRPSDEDVWIAGHWSARGNDYAWTRGRWERPKSDKKQWQNGRWEHEEHGWRYTEGYWH